MHRAFRALLAAALATSMIGLSATSASADRWWAGDKAGDVDQWSFSYEPPPCGTFNEVTVPRDASTDIVGLSVRHEGDTVEVRAHFRDLTGWGDRFVDFELETDRGAYTVSITRDPKTHPHAFDLYDASNPPSEPNDCGFYSTIMSGVSCLGMTMSRSTEHDVVSVVVPRSCLRSPRWVKAGVHGQREVNGRSRSDTWRTPDLEAERPTALLGPLGPRVRHSR